MGFAAFAALVVAGCQKHPSDDTVMVAPHPAAVAFSGTISKPLVGKWTSASHDDVWNLHSDGTAELASVLHGPGGAKKSDIQGDWRADGDSLLLKYTDGSGTPIVIKYEFTQVGKTLKVVQSGSGIKTTLTR